MGDLRFRPLLVAGRALFRGTVKPGRRFAPMASVVVLYVGFVRIGVPRLGTNRHVIQAELGREQRRPLIGFDRAVNKFFASVTSPENSRAKCDS